MKTQFYQMQKLVKLILHRILQRQLQIIHQMNFIQGILLDIIRESERSKGCESERQVTLYLQLFHFQLEMATFTGHNRSIIRVCHKHTV